jgi:hypothetical protein
MTATYSITLMFSAALDARVRTLCARCTRDRGCSAHPAFPAPSDLERAENFLQTSGATRREKAKLYQPSLRGALATKQSISPQKAKRKSGLLRFARNDGLG